MEGNITYKVTLKEVLFYEDNEMGGAVIVYKLVNNDDQLVLNDFYIVTFDDVSNEMVWGVGSTPELALENAEREWDRLNKDEGDNSINPFKHVLEKMKENRNLIPKVK